LTSEFLNSPNRLNVAMTRARKKLIIVGSKAFFSMIPHTESLLAKNSCFKQLLFHCRERNAVFSAEHLQPGLVMDFNESLERDDDISMQF
jgi:superfamily I DNA and/or RNA helicase